MKNITLKIFSCTMSVIISLVSVFILIIGMQEGCGRLTKREKIKGKLK